MALALVRETSPRPWGRLEVFPVWRIRLGNIPTPVGKTLPVSKVLIALGKHPHARGEDFNKGELCLATENYLLRKSSMNESNKLITPKYKQFLGTILVLLSALGFGTSGTIQAIAPVGATPYVIVAGRATAGAILLLTWCIVRKRFPKDFFFNSV